ncbi:MAG: RNA 2',3'-cyclic phosphodiesterase [Halanaerobium sp.]
MRLFIGVNINSRSKNLIEKKVELLKSEYNNQFKWIKKDNWHLTLKFIGEVSDTEKEKLINALKNVNFSEKDKYLQFARIDAFPELDAAKVLYLALKKGKKQLIKMHQQVEKELLKFGFESDQRDYIPHLTLARNKNDAFKIKKKFSQKDFINIYAQIESISLYQSQLKSSGPEYIELFSIK